VQIEGESFITLHPCGLLELLKLGAGMRSHAYPVHSGAAVALLSATPSLSATLPTRWLLKCTFEVSRFGYV